MRRLTFVLLGFALCSAVAAQEGRRFASSDLDEGTVLERLVGAEPENFRPVGTSSLTFQMQLDGEIDAAYRPATRSQPRGWASEIAAYRLAVRLGLDVVPPARLRIVDRTLLRRRIAPEFSGDRDALLAPMLSDAEGRVRGAATYWVPNLERSTLDQPAGLRLWTAWLAPGAVIPDAQRALAADLSAMCAFDALIGNADRMSGGNVRTVTHGGVQRVIIRDHNLAFPSRWADGQRERIVSELRRARRFSRHLVEAIAALDPAALGEVARDPSGEMLLDEGQLAAVLERRDMVLSYIGALSEAYGEERVLDL